MIVFTLYGSKKIITRSGFDPDLFMNIVEKHKVTTTLMTLNMIPPLQKCKNLRPLYSLKNIEVGGTKVPVNLAKSMARYFPNGHIQHAYGSSENSSVISVSFDRYDTVGNLVHGMEVKVKILIESMNLSKISNL